MTPQSASSQQRCYGLDEKLRTDWPAVGAAEAGPVDSMPELDGLDPDRCGMHGADGGLQPP